MLSCDALPSPMQLTLALIWNFAILSNLVNLPRDSYWKNFDIRYCNSILSILVLSRKDSVKMGIFITDWDNLKVTIITGNYPQAITEGFTLSLYLRLNGSHVSILYGHVYWWQCMHAWFIHTCDTYRSYTKCSVYFFTPFKIYLFV